MSSSEISLNKALNRESYKSLKVMKPLMKNSEDIEETESEEVYFNTLIL